MSKLWIYHKDKEPMIIEDDQAEDFYSKGWADSPAKFVKTTDFGIDPDDAVKVQQLGESLEGIKDMTNGFLNLQEMKDKELKEYAMTHFGESIKGRKEKLITQIEGFIHGNSAQVH